MDIKLEDGQVVVTRPNDLKKMKSLHGLTRTLIQNMVTGVSEGYTKTLEVNGVGYKAANRARNWFCLWVTLIRLRWRIRKDWRPKLTAIRLS